jgi:hypothetical protein
MDIGAFFIDWQMIVHYSMHLLFPFFIAWLFFRNDWKMAALIMLLTIIVDADHLFANPVFDPQRCSINFHPLHSYWAIGVYFAGLFYRKTRWVATGLILHMSADLLDCLWTFKDCHECFVNSAVYQVFSKI